MLVLLSEPSKDAYPYGFSRVSGIWFGIRKDFY